MTAVTESWFPAGNHTYGIILEDDIQVSPHFYAWTKIALLRYRCVYAYGNRESMSLIRLVKVWRTRESRVSAIRDQLV